MPICAICGQDIAPADDSEEHILPGAIGGRRTVGGFLHDGCTHRSGHPWDAALEKQLRPLFRPRFLGHLIEPYAASAAAGSCLERNCSGVRYRCRSISQVVL